MPVQINEIIIRAIITNDDKNSKANPQPTPKKADGNDGENKFEILELIDEVLKNRKER